MFVSCILVIGYCDDRSHMFLNVAEALKEAREKSFAIGAFNTSNLEVTKAICNAAKKLDKKIIIQTTPSSIEYAGLTQIFNIVKNEIELSNIEAAIHLDHGQDFETAQKCIDIGYRSVMIDGSKLSFEENVALTNKVVEYAHPKNVSVEGEIGIVGSKEYEENGGHILSDPEETAKFIELTGIDSIAVSVGNRHGAPSDEKLNIPLLKEIASKVKIPLVLHGSSGLSEEDLKEAIKLGVTKVNIDTLVRKAFMASLSDIDPEIEDYREILKNTMVEIEKVVEERINILSSSQT